MGDGDQGVTMAIGFGAIRKVLDSLRDQDIGTILTKSGLTFNGTAASTIGALLATACMRAGREAKGKHEIGLADLATMLAAAQTGIQERGKAQVGDKTVLDALAPTVTALQAAAAAGLPLPEALRRSLAAAEVGPPGHHSDEGEDGARRLDRRAQRGPPGSRRHLVLPDVEVGGGVSDLRLLKKAHLRRWPRLGTRCGVPGVRLTRPSARRLASGPF